MKKRTPLLARPFKMLCWFLALVIVVFMVYITLGCPPLSSEMAFRRAERANLVGPSRILAKFHHSEYDHRNIIIAETKDSYMLFLDTSHSLNYDRFYNPTKQGESVYSFFCTYPKTGQMSVHHVPVSYRPTDLILFDLEPNALRAELEFKLEYGYDGKVHTMPITVEARREYPSFFIFSLNTDNATEQWYRAMSDLQSLFSEYGSNKPAVTVRLYDANDHLIRTETVIPGPDRF